MKRASVNYRSNTLFTVSNVTESQNHTYVSLCDSTECVTECLYYKTSAGLVTGDQQNITEIVYHHYQLLTSSK